MQIIRFRQEGATNPANDTILSNSLYPEYSHLLGPANVSNSVSINVQPIRAIGAENARFKDRGNRSGNWNFTGTRRFSSLEDAGRYYATHGMSCPASGTLIIMFSTSGAQQVSLLLGCHIDRIGDMRQIGVTIYATYSISYSDAVSVDVADIQTTIDAFYNS